MGSKGKKAAVKKGEETGRGGRGTKGDGSEKAKIQTINGGGRGPAAYSRRGAKGKVIQKKKVRGCVLVERWKKAKHAKRGTRTIGI